MVLSITASLTYATQSKLHIRIAWGALKKILIPQDPPSGVLVSGLQGIKHMSQFNQSLYKT